MILDIVFMCILCYAGYRGYLKGFIQQAITLIALFAGILGAILFSDIISKLIQRIANTDSEYIPIIAFAVTFVIILIAMEFLGRWIEKLLKVVSMSLLNRIVGIFFNVAKFILIISIVLTVINKLDELRASMNRNRKVLELIARLRHTDDSKDLEKQAMDAMQEWSKSPDPIIPRSWTEDSKLYEPLSNIAPGLFPYLKFRIPEAIPLNRPDPETPEDRRDDETGNSLITQL